MVCSDNTLLLRILFIHTLHRQQFSIFAIYSVHHNEYLMPSESDHFLDSINQALATQSYGQQPPTLYEPIRYIMGLGGKRLRPALTLLAYRLFCLEGLPAAVVRAALAVEVFHNFTLMHDDIMDQAPLRRGQPTVHERWNANIAILSGDVMLVKAYELLMDVPAEQLPTVLTAFNRCATEVCEGQQWDMDFETTEQVTETDYLRMIRQKTGVLLGFSLQLGGMLAGASAEDTERLYQAGENIGIGFQLKDDLLDVYADQSKFGKQVGGDIIANKKTFLLIRALAEAKEEEQRQLIDWISRKQFDKQEKIAAVKSIYDTLNIRTTTRDKMNEYFGNGLQCLHQLSVAELQKETLRAYVTQLIDREK